MRIWRRIGGWLGVRLAEGDLRAAQRLADALDYEGALRLLDRPTRDLRLRRRAERQRVVLLERMGFLPQARDAAEKRRATEPRDAGAQADALRLAHATGETPPVPVLPQPLERADVPLVRHAAQRAMAEGRHGDAVALTADAVALTGAETDAAQHVAMTMVAGDPGAAEALAADYAACFPGSARFPLRLAQFAERRRDWAAMLARHEAALAADPASRPARSGKARALVFLERFEDAAASLRASRGDDWMIAMDAFLQARKGDAGAAVVALDTLYEVGASHLEVDRRGRARDPRNAWLGDRHVSHPSPFAVANNRHFARFLADLDRAERIMLVGNSPALIGRGLGAEIDAADLVIRLNDFVTTGFEADVGRRTDWWLSSAAKQARPDPASIAGANALLIQPVAQHFPDPAAFVRGRLGLVSGPRAVGYLPPWLHRLSEAIPYPTKTMGFRAIVMLEFLLQRPFRAIGFDFFASEGMHYFDPDQTRLRVSEIHAIDFERAFVAEVLAKHARFGRYDPA